MLRAARVRLAMMQVYLDGQIMPVTEARVTPLDRGFIFGDGVYEGLYAVPRKGGGARIVGLKRHTQRIADGMAALGITGWDAGGLGRISEEIVAANGLSSAFVYVQVTRGAPAAAWGGEGLPRLRVPAGDERPCVFAFAHTWERPEALTEPKCKTAAVREDQRWALGRLKSISLAGNVIAALDAHAARADDALLIRGGEEGLLAEALAANALIVTADGEVATPSLESVPILGGVTRAILLDVCPEIVSRPVRVSEMRAAREVMLCGTTSMVTAVTMLDGEPVGDGKAGPVARRLNQALISAILEGRDDP